MIRLKTWSNSAKNYHYSFIFLRLKQNLKSKTFYYLRLQPGVKNNPKLPGALAQKPAKVQAKPGESYIGELNKQIQKAEDEIRMIIQNDDSLEVNYNLAKSVVGVGPGLVAYLIAFTNNFINLDNHRSFACFAGIAPYSESSGKQKGNAPVHPYANRQLKSLFNMGEYYRDCCLSR